MQPIAKKVDFKAEVLSYIKSVFLISRKILIDRLIPFLHITVQLFGLEC